MGSPFRVREIAGKNTNEQRPVVQPLAGKHIVRSVQTGDPLPTPSVEEPDREPRIPWPAAQPFEQAGHKPFKNTK